MSLFWFVVVLGVLIFVHELGHFLAAKSVGVAVLRFSLGFGPLTPLRFRKGETEYCVSWFPLGGYVKMAGLEEEGAAGDLEGPREATEEVQVDPSRTFDAKPLWARLFVMVAGVTMNVLFAIVAFAWLGARYGIPRPQTHAVVGAVRENLLPAGAESLQAIQAGDTILRVGERPISSAASLEDAFTREDGMPLRVYVSGRSEPLPVNIPMMNQEGRLRALLALMPMHRPVAGQVIAGGAAEAAGLREGDDLIRINGDTLRSWEQMVSVIERSAGDTLTVTIARGGELRDVQMVPREEQVPAEGGGTRAVGKVGLGYVTDRQDVGLGSALRHGVDESLRAGGSVLFVLKGMVTGKLSPRDLGGPIMIGQLSGQMARAGAFALVSFMALLSMNLAVLNLLPIPVLDGGHIVFLLAEAVRRKPVSVIWRQRLTTAGLVFLVMLMLFATANDITRIVSKLF